MGYDSLARWQLLQGSIAHRTAQDNVSHLIPDASVDCVLVDVPYGSTQNEWDIRLDLTKLRPFYQRVLKPKAAIVMFSDMRYALDELSAWKDIFRFDYVWGKNTSHGHLNANRQPMRSHEHMLVFGFEAPLFWPRKTDGHPRKVGPNKTRGLAINTYGAENGIPVYDRTTRYDTTVLDQFDVVHKFKSCAPERIHPQQKPVALLAYLLRSLTRPGALVLDHCAGSGSTGVAALQSMRRFVGIEAREDYATAAREWLTREAEANPIRKHLWQENPEDPEGWLCTACKLTDQHECAALPCDPTSFVPVNIKDVQDG